MTKTLIEESFSSWINNYPTSLHPCDMDRFYKFVKTVLRDGRNLGKRDYVWFKEKVDKSGKSLSEEDVEYFFDLFVKFKDFNSITPMKREYDGLDLNGKVKYKIR